MYTQDVHFEADADMFVHLHVKGDSGYCRGLGLAIDVHTCRSRRQCRHVRQVRLLLMCVDKSKYTQDVDLGYVCTYSGYCRQGIVLMYTCSMCMQGSKAMKECAYM